MIGIALAIAAAGNKLRLAKLLGITHQSINQWTRIPAERVIQIEELTDVPREKLRPDLYAPRKKKS